MFKDLSEINKRPEPFECYTTSLLWDDDYISQKMLEAHLDQNNDVASRNKVFFDKAIKWIQARFNIGSKSRICDFGCGPGLYTTEFAKKDADVTGIDFARLSIKHAKKTALQNKLNIEYVIQDYLKFSTDKRFNLITMLQHDFCALSPKQRKTLINKFHTLLENNGKLLIDVYSTTFFDATKEEANYEKSSNKDFWSNFWSDKPYYVFNNTFKYEQEKLWLNKHTIIEENRIRRVYNWLQSYNVENLTKEFEENGFKIIEHYSDITGSPYESDSTEFAVVAQTR